MEWIGVYDRLPAAGRIVFVCGFNAEDDVVRGYYSNREGWQIEISYAHGHFVPAKVTFWMPIPEPPVAKQTGPPSEELAAK